MNGKRKRHSIDQTVRSLLPESVRKDCLMKLRESIIRANEGGSNKWGVYHGNNHIRLLVGSLIIFTIERKGIWLALDNELLDRSTEKSLDDSPDWLWAGEGEYPIYDEKYSVDPIRDLRPVCPNCHAIMHKQKPAFTVEEVRHFIAQAAKSTCQIDIVISGQRFSIGR